MIGYTRAHRSRFKHPLFKSQKFCRGYAWDWMVAQAAFKDHIIEIKGKMVRLERGQFSHSMRYMAGKFGWSLGVVQRFINRLETECMIDTAMDSGQMVVTVCNYEEYQSDAANAETENDTANDTGPIQDRYRTDTIKKEGKRKKRNGNTSGPFRFEEFWDSFPHRNGAKKGKDGSLKKYTVNFKAGILEDAMIDGAIRYSKDRQVVDGFGKGPEPWLNQKCWKDDIEYVHKNGTETLDPITGAPMEVRR